MKKGFSLFIFLFIMLILCSCSSNIENTDKNKIFKEIPELDSNENITINYYYQDFTNIYNGYIYEQIYKFNSLFPNITVFTHPIVDLNYLVSLNADVENGVIMGSKYLIKELIKNDYITELDSYVASDNVGYSLDEQSKFIDVLWNEGTTYNYDGTRYTLPYRETTEVLVYNKTIFDRYSYKVPETWDDIIEICEDYVTRPEYVNLKNNGVNPSVVCFVDNFSLFENITAQWNGQFNKFNKDGSEEYTLDNSKSTAAMLFIKENFDKGYFSTLKKYNLEDGHNMMDDGQALMVVSPFGSIGSYRSNDGTFEVDITSYPQKDVKNPKINYIGDELALLKSNNAQEELGCWLFMKFLISEESMLEYSNIHPYVLPRRRVINYMINELTSITNYDEWSKILIHSEIVMLKQAKNCLYRNNVFSNSREVNLIIHTMVDEILYDNKSIELALKDIINIAN